MAAAENVLLRLSVITIGIACINFTKVFTDHNAATALCMVFVLSTFVAFMACELRHQLKLRKKEVYNPEEAEDMQERESFGFDLKLLSIFAIVNFGITIALCTMIALSQ